MSSIQWIDAKDYVTKHYLAFSVGVVAITVVTLWVMGRNPICSCGYVKVWHGALTDQSSQHLTDWFTLHHFLRGIITFAGLAYFFPKLRWESRFLAAVSLEAAWELFENSPYIIERYRSTANATYTGDAVVNSLADILAMIAGYMFASRYKWWIVVGVGIAIEVFTLILIRDSLLLNVIMLIYPVEAIKQWQLAAWT